MVTVGAYGGPPENSHENQLSPASSKAPFAARGTRPHGPRGGCPTNHHRHWVEAGAPGKSLVEWEISGKDVCFLMGF